MRLPHGGHFVGTVFVARRHDSRDTDEDEDDYLSPLGTGCRSVVAQAKLSPVKAVNRPQRNPPRRLPPEFCNCHILRHRRAVESATRRNRHLRVRSRVSFPRYHYCRRHCDVLELRHVMAEFLLSRCRTLPDIVRAGALSRGGGLTLAVKRCILDATYVTHRPDRFPLRPDRWRRCR